jgi:pimeloyl-ACP methyl ester carboxylesterase
MKDIFNAKSVLAFDGLQLYYWITWNKELKGGFVVLHPGSSMNHSSLESLEKGLNERGHPTIVFDPRWDNYPDALTKREHYSVEHCSGDLQKIIEKEGLEKPALLGHSAGFMPIVDYASRTSNAKQLIGICASHKFSETAQNKFLFHLFNKGLRYTEYLGSLGTNIAHKLKGEQRSYPDQSALQDKSELSTWLSIVDAPLRSIKAHIISGIEINTWDISKQLAEIDKPMLLVYGSKDFMVKPMAGDYIRSIVKWDCRIEIIEGTHSLPMKKHKDILKIIEGYFSRV